VKREIVFRPLAKLELDEAVDWYEKREAGLGCELKEAVDQLLARIAAAPEQFRTARGSVRRAVLRRFPYILYFLPEPRAVVVLAVFHGKRDPRQLEGRC
jgi:plasmid stabilization system protein ParE